MDLNKRSFTATAEEGEPGSPCHVRIAFHVDMGCVVRNNELVVRLRPGEDDLPHAEAVAKTLNDSALSIAADDAAASTA